MKKTILMALVLFCCWQTSGQRKLQVSERDMSSVIFREAGDNETVVEVQSNVPLSFESTMDKQVNVYEMYPESGFFIYRLKFSTGNTYRGRQLIIKSYGFMNYDYPLELQAKKPVGLLVLDPEMKIGADIITLANGDHIQALVQKIGEVDIEYKKINNPTGPNYSLRKSEIFMITYVNGSKEMFAPSQATNQQTIGNKTNVDVITFKNGTDIQAFVQEIGEIDIKYKRFDNPNGPNYSLKKSEILMIRYANGSKDVFTNNTVPATTSIIAPVTNVNSKEVTTSQKSTAHTVLSSGITISPAENISVASERTATFRATVLPYNATNKDVTWSSLNTDIATVNASTGVVTGISGGTATIRATAADGSGITADKSITVYVPIKVITIDPEGSAFIEVGRTATLTATIAPLNATNGNVTWSSLNATIATVSAQTGVVTGVNIGTTTIRAMATDGSRITASKSVTIFKTHPAEPKMVLVEGGSFLRDNSGFSLNPNISNAHQVTVSSFYIGIYEITQGQWQSVMNTNPSKSQKGDNYPVENISWDDAQKFIKRLNVLTGKNYRLPTEAEWEYAARGGSKSQGYKYSGSDNIDDVSWYTGNSDYVTHPVGAKRPNELGVFDMSGNVREWCQDWFGDFGVNALTNPKGPSKGISLVVRGGSCNTTESGNSVYYRGMAMPEFKDRMGLRIALSQ